MQTEHRIDLTPAYRVNALSGKSSGHGKAIMHYEGADIGSSRQPIYDAARYLLANGLALPSDRITTYKDGRACMLSIIGRAAKLTVEESDMGGIRLRAFKPPQQKAVVQRETRVAECLAAE